MDCASARLLLNFVRAGELDQVERAALEGHLAGCPDCAAIAISEARFDEALETAMPRVAVPAGLKGRILTHLAARRRPRPWPWVAAAAILLATGLTGAILMAQARVELDSSALVVKVDIIRSHEAVSDYFGSIGLAMAAPRDFNFHLLDTLDVAEVQGRKVPKLTFLSRADNRAAHVYVLQTSQFKLPAGQERDAGNNNWPGEISIPSSTHNIQIRRYPSAPEFFYLVIFNGASLEPFLLEGI